jgi:predicted transcriptional regulator
MIMAEIINYAKAGALKTQIMYKANLSFTQLTQYLQFLTRNKLLEKSTFDRKEVYKATQKGLNFVEKQQQMVSLLNEDAQGNRVKYLPAKLEKSLGWTKNNSKYSIILRSFKQP